MDHRRQRIPIADYATSGEPRACLSARVVHLIAAVREWLVGVETCRHWEFNELRGRRPKVAGCSAEMIASYRTLVGYGRTTEWTGNSVYDSAEWIYIHAATNGAG
jgi:hypothetical protein